jgi:hypothetical protein
MEGGMNKKQTKGCAIVPASSNAKLQGRENILMARSWGADTVYELADAFRQRCLIESNSLLWPNEPVWTTDNITELERVAFNRDDPSIPQELVYWDDVSRTLTLPLRKLGADIALMYQLFPSKSAQTKFGDVRYMFDGNDPPLVPHADVWTLFEQAAGHGLGDAGRWYLSGGQQWSALFYLRFAKEVKTSSVDVYDRPTMQALADRVEESIRYNTVTARNMILHLFFPDYFEPISNQGHKEDIRAAFCSRLGIPATDDIDHDLWVIRDRMVADGRTDHFNFYDGDLRPLWNNWRKNPSVPEPTGDDDTIHREPLTALQENDLRTLMEPTHLNESVLQEINELLLTKRQLIFEGPPGSGKTFVAEKFARWFTGQPLDATSPLNEQVEIVQFHQSYGYEDFSSSTG